MKNPKKTPRFEVEFKERLAQSKQAADKLRLPALGYRQYLVSKKPVKQFSNLENWQLVILDFIAALEEHQQKELKWLKPKHVTMLHLKGHTVEEVNDTK